MENNKLICPLCQDRVDKLVYRFHLESERVIIDKIRNEFPEWTEEDGICHRCIDYFHTEIFMGQRILPSIGPYFPVKSPDDFIILPTPIRMDADPRFSGSGVTICFIDSGWYPHPDLVAARNRVRLYMDVTSDRVISNEEAALFSPSSAWHGTMTSVVCAGDGYCSRGLYKGIASEANLVILKVQDDQGRILTDYLVKALKWILTNHQFYGIKVVNISLGDDHPLPFQISEVDQLAEAIIDEGVSIVAAVGNDENGSIKPPASSPRVIAVGGIDDRNILGTEEWELYHSTFGSTLDGFQKPELVAHAIWVAAPILPGTSEHEEAKSLHHLLSLPDTKLSTVFEENNIAITKKLRSDNSHFQINDVTFLRKLLAKRVQETKFFSPDYMHVDGSSFAAPVVTAVIAQLLQANPNLTPDLLRKVLFETAKRLPLPVIRQGFGMINARKALLKTLKKEVRMKPQLSPYINPGKKTIAFYIECNCASQISLAGSFNQWAQDVLLMEPLENGLWKIEIPMLPAGKYQYKFFIDDRMWMEDIDNPFREPDGFNGWNSLLFVENLPQKTHKPKKRKVKELEPALS